MSKFENLTKYLPHLDEDKFGTWVIDHKNDGTPEHPIQMPFVNYSEMVHHFIDDGLGSASLNWLTANRTMRHADTRKQ